ncbi:MAG: hypothetical protein V3S54_00480, partial [Woeseiaceae bacterium]
MALASATLTGAASVLASTVSSALAFCREGDFFAVPFLVATAFFFCLGVFLLVIGGYPDSARRHAINARTMST